jgi:transposase
MVVSDGHGTPLAILTETASTHEVKLIEPLLKRIRLPRRGRGRPKTKLSRLIYDKAADSDSLRRPLRRRGTDLIVPHRAGRVQRPTQDRRKLRRYGRRWKIERTFAWLQNFRRLVVRHDRKITMFEAYLQLGCTIITLNKL